MPVYCLPGCVFGWSQAVARQYALVQALEFFDDERLDAGPLILRDIARHGSLDAGEWLVFRMADDLADGLLDQVTPGQAQGGGRVRPDSDSGRGIPVSIIGSHVQVAQQFDACQLVYAAGGVAVGSLGDVQEGQGAQIGAKQRQVRGQPGSAFVDVGERL